MSIIGIPCSVSSSGIFGDKPANMALKRYIYESEKGLVVALNLKQEFVQKGLASGTTFPSIVISNVYKTWEDYLNAFRSNYRWRLKKINLPIDELRLENQDCSLFTDVMYQQYLNVHNRSEGKLEKLTFEFFKNLPPEFTMTVCYKQHNIIGWNITLGDNGKYYFFLGGIDYDYNNKYDTYYRLLSSIVRNGIDKNYSLIELGQTAEIPKMRMGGEQVKLYLEAKHSNRLLNLIIKKSTALLVYKRKLEPTQAMKKNRD